MNTYIHTQIHACINTCIHTHTHTYTHAYIHTRIHTYIHRAGYEPSGKKRRKAADYEDFKRQYSASNTEAWTKEKCVCVSVCTYVYKVIMQNLSTNKVREIQ